MNLEAVAAEWFECREGLRTYKCQTGDEYVALVSGGIKPEGEQFPAYYLSRQLAEAAWVNSFQAYASGKKGVLYWRERPYTEEVTYVSPEFVGTNWTAGMKKACYITLYVVYSRLVITDKKEI